MEGKASIIPIYGMFTTDGCFSKAAIANKEMNSHTTQMIFLKPVSNWLNVAGSFN